MYILKKNILVVSVNVLTDDEQRPFFYSTSVKYKKLKIKKNVALVTYNNNQKYKKNSCEIFSTLSWFLNSKLFIYL